MKNNISNISNNSYLFFFNENSTLYKNSISLADKKVFPALNKNNSYIKKSNDNSTLSAGDETKNLQEEKFPKDQNHNQISSSTNPDTLSKNPLDSYHLVNCRSVTDFEKIEEIGEGTYGRVCKLF